jgi:hypothetical protein
MNDVNKPLSVRKPTASTKPAIAMKSVASAQWRTAAELNFSSPGAALPAGGQLGLSPGERTVLLEHIVGRSRHKLCADRPDFALDQNTNGAVILRPV